MTTKMKKVLFLLICVAAIPALVFSAAQGEEGAAADEQVTLKWLATGPGVQKDLDMVLTELNSMLPQYVPNTQFELEIVPPPDYKQKFDLMMAASETLDIAWKGWMQPFAEEVGKGSYMELDDLIDQYAPDIKKEVPSWLLTAGRIDGKLYLIPKYEMHYWQLAVFADADNFEQYFDVEAWKEAVNGDMSYTTVLPEVYDAMENYMKTLQDAGVAGSGFSPWVFTTPRGEDLIGGPPSWTYTMPAIARGYHPGYEWDFTVINTYEAPETIELFKKMAEWREEGYLREDMLSLSNPREFENTNAGGYDIWFHNYVNPLGGDYVRETRWSKEHVRIAIDKYPSVKPGPNDGQTIPRTAKYPDRAIQVLALMTTSNGSDFYNTMVWGLEDVHYKRVNDKRIETFDYTGQGGAEAPYGLWKWALGNVWNAWFTQADLSDEIWEYFDEMHATGIKSPYTGFVFNTDNVINELAQVRSVLSEYVKAFMSGHYEEALYNEFLDKLDKAGTDKLIEEAQMQLDAHLEANGIPKTGYVQ